MQSCSFQPSGDAVFPLSAMKSLKLNALDILRHEVCNYLKAHAKKNSPLQCTEQLVQQHITVISMLKTCAAFSLHLLTVMQKVAFV